MENFRDKLCKIFRENVIPVGSPYIAEFNESVESILEDNQPKKLYRFRVCNTLSFDALLRNQCYLSAPTQFNDPFDSILPNDDSDIRELHTQVHDIMGMRKALEETGRLPLFHQRLWPEDLQKSISLRLLGIPSTLLPMAAAEAAKKRDVLLQNVKEDTDMAMKSVQEHSYIACFSERIDSILMWSHYADYHKGFALEYDFTANQTNDIQSQDLFPVMYSETPYNAKDIVSWFVLKKHGTEMPLPDVNYWLKAALFKAKEWEYENEWRLLKKRDDNDPLFTSVELIPCAIYYGCKIGDAELRILHNIANQLGLKEYKMEIDQSLTSYSVKPIEL